MRRRLMRWGRLRWRAILLCLLAGAAVNVLVAWGLCLWTVRWGAIPGAPITGPLAAAAGWPGGAPADWPPVASLRYYHRPGGTLVVADSAVLLGGSQASHGVLANLAGWPCRALVACQETGYANQRPHRCLRFRSAWAGWYGGIQFWERHARGQTLTQLPVRPLWAGLVVNTALYGGLVYGLCLGAGRVRVRRRRRRGQCPACGYDLRGIASACPECGTPQEAAP